MSLLTVLILVVAALVCCALIALADRMIGPKLGYPRYVVHFAYALILLIVVIYVCRALGLFSLFSSVRV